MKHGTTTAYMQHGCRCEVCRISHSRHQKRYRVDRLRGVQRLVDAQPLRDHIDALTAAGMSQWDITIAAGWKSRNALADAYRRAKVTPRTLQRVLAVTAPPVSRRNGYVDATGSRRRLQALAVMGWPTLRIANMLGKLDPQTYQYIQSGRNRTVRRRTAEAITELYNQMWDQRGPSKRTSALALRKGWAPPLAWDDEHIDDPRAHPVGQGWTPRSQSQREAVVEDFLDTWDHHRGDIDIAASRLGMKPGTLERALYRARAGGCDVDFGYGRASA